MKWKQIGVIEIANQPELPFFIQWMTSDHPSQEGRPVSEITKIEVAAKGKLDESWFTDQIVAGLDGVAIDWIDPDANDGETGIVAIHVKSDKGEVRLD